MDAQAAFLTEHPTVGQPGADATCGQPDTVGSAAVDRVTRRAKKTGKRHSLRSLAPNWREIIFAAISSDRLRLAVAVLSATGCRPSELERGVIVQVLSDGQLRLGICGTKVDEAIGRGQPRRALWVDPASPWGNFLRQAAGRLPTGKMIVTYDAEGVSQRLREKSKEIWPRRKTLISAYSYRHYIAMSLKESGASADLIARVLGHASDFAQTAYGRAGANKSSAGKHGVIEAKVANAVRHSPKTDRLLRLSDREAAKLSADLPARGSGTS